MRRSDREITDKAEIIEIINKCNVCRLGLSSNNIPYIVPMNFGYDYIDEKLTLYFHGAGEGKKLDVISVNPSACFEMDCSHRLIEGSSASDFSMEYESVIGYGTVYICTTSEEKAKALERLMKKCSPARDFEFADELLANVTAFKLVVSDFTGKRNIKK